MTIHQIIIQSLYVGIFYVGINWLISKYRGEERPTPAGMLISGLGFALLFGTVQWYFMPTEKKPEVPGQRFEAPAVEETQRSLNREVNFAQTAAEPEQRTIVKTNYGQLVFSTHGATLSAATYHHQTDHVVVDLESIHPKPETEREKAFFLVALDEHTPYYYTLGELTENDEQIRLQYHATTSAGQIEKLFIIDKNKYKIDVALTIKPEGAVRPRLIWASPFIFDHTKPENVSGVVDENHSLTKYGLSGYREKLNDSLWLSPTTFGAEDRYFLHALCADPHHFAQRAYYRVGVENIYPILEGPTVSKETTWQLSFYVGPKEHEALVAVDAHLADTLDYGWLGFIAKPMLAILKWLAQYLHSFGWAIILFTLVLRLLLLPLSMRGTKAAQQGQEMQRKLAYLKQRYKDDPEGLQREQAALIQKYGMASLGGFSAGCLPLLIQLPLFFAMNRVLSSSIELYRAPFLWMRDLSAKDPLYILPVLVAASFLLTTMQTGERQQRVQGIFMALFFGAFAVGFSAGLSLFFIVSTLVGAVPLLMRRKA